MNRFWLILAIVFISLASGGRELQATAERPSALRGTQSDSLLSFVWNKHIISFSAPKSDLDLYRGLQAFLDSVSVDRLAYLSLEMADVTGDGILDSCTTQIALLNGHSFVRHLVRSKGRTIWNDTITLSDNSVSPLFWQDESSYDQLRPLSNFYVATRLFGKFVSDTVRWSDVEHSEFIGYRDSQRSYWEQYFRTVTVRAIKYIAIPGHGEMFWHSPEKRFIRLWGP